MIYDHSSAFILLLTRPTKMGHTSLCIMCVSPHDTSASYVVMSLCPKAGVTYFIKSLRAFAPDQPPMANLITRMMSVLSVADWSEFRN